MTDIPRLKVKVIGYANHIKVNEEWVECETVPEAYKKYKEKHPQADICYLGELKGEYKLKQAIVQNKKGKGAASMSIKEKTNTTEVYVEDKTMVDGKVVPVAKKNGDSAQATLPLAPVKENKVSEKEKKTAAVKETKPAAKPAKVSKPVAKPKSTKPAAKKVAVKKAVKAPAKEATAKATKKENKPRTDRLAIGRVETSGLHGKKVYLLQHFAKLDEAKAKAGKIREAGTAKMVRIYPVNDRFALFTENKPK